VYSCRGCKVCVTKSWVRREREQPAPCSGQAEMQKEAVRKLLREAVLMRKPVFEKADDPMRS
jgi:hypothetical protein